MKITQDLRAEVQAMGENERRALGLTPEQIEAAEGMKAKSEEFMEKGGKLYVEQ